MSIGSGDIPIGGSLLDGGDVDDANGCKISREVHWNCSCVGQSNPIVVTIGTGTDIQGCLRADGSLCLPVAPQGNNSDPITIIGNDSPGKCHKVEGTLLSDGDAYVFCQKTNPASVDCPLYWDVQDPNQQTGD